MARLSDHSDSGRAGIPDSTERAARGHRHPQLDLSADRVIALSDDVEDDSRLGAWNIGADEQ